MTKIEYVTLDYDGEPVVIENGEILCDDYLDHKASFYVSGDIAPTVYQEWNSETCEWEDPEDPRLDMCDVPDKTAFDYWCEYGRY